MDMYIQATDEKIYIFIKIYMMNIYIYIHPVNSFSLENPE